MYVFEGKVHPQGCYLIRFGCILYVYIVTSKSVTNSDNVLKTEGLQNWVGQIKTFCLAFFFSPFNTYFIMFKIL